MKDSGSQPGMKLFFVQTLSHCCKRICSIIQKGFITWTKPTKTSLIAGAASDLPKSKAELMAENALLRQQLIILNRMVKKPSFNPWDRFLLVFLASKLANWKQALLILKPDTLLRWHRQGFRLFRKLKSNPNKNSLPKIAHETNDLIKEMAVNNPLWGAERIRGELLKLDIKVAKRTIQKYMRQARPKRPSSNTHSSTSTFAYWWKNYQLPGLKWLASCLSKNYLSTSDRSGSQYRVLRNSP